MKGIILKLASEAMTHMAVAEDVHIYTPVKAEVLKWYTEKFQSSVDEAHREGMLEILEANQAALRMILSAALRRHILSTTTLKNRPNTQDIRNIIARELDLVGGCLMDDVSSSISNSSLENLVEDDRYDNIVMEVADHMMSVAVEVVEATFEVDVSEWDTLIESVQTELATAAQHLKIVTYLSDSDNVVFVEQDYREEVMVYGVAYLPSPSELFKVGDMCDEKSSAAFSDFMGRNLACLWWSDDYIFTVNNEPAHPDYYNPKKGDNLAIYEVSECKN